MKISDTLQNRTQHNIMADAVAPSGGPESYNHKGLTLEILVERKGFFFVYWIVHEFMQDPSEDYVKELKVMDPCSKDFMFLEKFIQKLATNTVNAPTSPDVKKPMSEMDEININRYADSLCKICNDNYFQSKKKNFHQWKEEYPVMKEWSEK